MKAKEVVVAVGMFLSLTVAEIVLQLGGTAIPVPSDWPSVEAELKSEQISELPDEIGIVFLGSSITEAAVDPGYLVDLGVVDSAYNAALPFSTPSSNEVWLRDVILPAVEPDVVVIGLPIWPAHDDQVTALERGLQEAALDDGNAGLGESALWRHRGVLGSLDDLLIRKQWMDAGIIDELGHHTGYYDARGRTIADYFGPYGRPEMTSRQDDALKAMVETARSGGAEVVILLEPGRYPRAVPESTVTDYIEWVSARAIQLDVPFWDTYSRDWDPDLFADEAHFNRSGTLLYSELLGVLLQSYLTADESTTAHVHPAPFASSGPYRVLLDQV